MESMRPEHAVGYAQTGGEAIAMWGLSLRKRGGKWALFLITYIYILIFQATGPRDGSGLEGDEDDETEGASMRPASG